MTSKYTFSVLMGIFLVFAGCHSVSHVKCDAVDLLRNLPWLRSMVADIKSKGADNKDAEIIRYIYYNRPVFYVIGRCCDMPNELFDCDGNKICEPDGGIAGIGDGNCANFLELREEPIGLYPPRNK